MAVANPEETYSSKVYMDDAVTRIYTTVETFNGSFKVNEFKVNEFKYKFLCNPVNKCSIIDHSEVTRKMDHKNNNNTNGYKTIVLFMVKSAFENRQRRDVIRHTWGNETYHYNNGIDIRTVFTLGLSSNDSKSNIREEFDIYGDIIQANFIDRYFNNTLKTISNINWASKYCQRAKYVVLLDDDFFVNPQNLIKMLDGLPIKNRTGLYMGQLFEGYEPHRDPKSKWFVSETEYPLKKYPPFISAGTIILSWDVVLKLQDAMQYVKPYRLDDIYVAIVAQKLTIQPLSHPDIFSYKVLPGHRFFKSIIAAHGYKTEDMEKSWKSVLKDT